MADNGTIVLYRQPQGICGHWNHSNGQGGGCYKTLAEDTGYELAKSLNHTITEKSFLLSIEEDKNSKTKLFNYELEKIAEILNIEIHGIKFKYISN